MSCCGPLLWDCKAVTGHSMEKRLLSHACVPRSSPGWAWRFHHVVSSSETVDGVYPHVCFEKQAQCVWLAGKVLVNGTNRFSSFVLLWQLSHVWDYVRVESCSCLAFHKIYLSRLLQIPSLLEWSLKCLYKNKPGGTSWGMKYIGRNVSRTELTPASLSVRFFPKYLGETAFIWICCTMNYPTHTEDFSSNKQLFGKSIHRKDFSRKSFSMSWQDSEAGACGIS